MLLWISYVLIRSFVSMIDPLADVWRRGRFFDGKVKVEYLDDDDGVAVGAVLAAAADQFWAWEQACAAATTRAIPKVFLFNHDLSPLSQTSENADDVGEAEAVAPCNKATVDGGDVVASHGRGDVDRRGLFPLSSFA